MLPVSILPASCVFPVRNIIPFVAFFVLCGEFGLHAFLLAVFCPGDDYSKNKRDEIPTLHAHLVSDQNETGLPKRALIVPLIEANR